METNNEIRIVLGDVSFSIVTTDRQLIDELKINFMLSPNEYKAALTLRVDYLSTCDKSIINEVHTQIGNAADIWGKIGYGHNKIKGYYKWHESYLEILFEKEVRSLPVSHIFSLIASSFYILDKQRKTPKIQNSLLLHAAGIIRNNQGFIFTGPSRSGKSTVARLSQNDSVVINDECMLLQQINGGYQLTNTPIKSSLYNSEKRNEKLKYIFFLTKSDRHSLKRVRGPDAAIRLFESLFYPANFSENLTESLSEKLRLVSELINNVPCYEMHFAQDNGFWHEITRIAKE
jgi:hypothetical protein